MCSILEKKSLTFSFSLSLSHFLCPSLTFLHCLIFSPPLALTLNPSYSFSRCSLIASPIPSSIFFSPTLSFLVSHSLPPHIALSTSLSLSPPLSLFITLTLSSFSPSPSLRLSLALLPPPSLPQCQNIAALLRQI